MNLRQQRIYDAGLAGLRNRMVEEWRIPAPEADRLLAAWAVEASRRGLSSADFGWWRDAPDWIADQRQRAGRERQNGSQK